MHGLGSRCGAGDRAALDQQRTINALDPCPKQSARRTSIYLRKSTSRNNQCGSSDTEHAALATALVESGVTGAERKKLRC
jgi:hypothetical protein